MTERLTPEAEAELRALEQKATPGPWSVHELDISGHWYRDVPIWVVREDPDSPIGDVLEWVVRVETDGYQRDATDAEAEKNPEWQDADEDAQPARNLRFIAAARSAVPVLLAELDAQRATVSILRDDSAEARTEARQYAEHAARLQTDLNAARAELERLRGCVAKAKAALADANLASINNSLPYYMEGAPANFLTGWHALWGCINRCETWLRTAVEEVANDTASTD